VSNLSISSKSVAGWHSASDFARKAQGG